MPTYGLGQIRPERSLLLHRVGIEAPFDPRALALQGGESGAPLNAAARGALDIPRGPLQLSVEGPRLLKPGHVPPWGGGGPPKGGPPKGGPPRAQSSSSGGARWFPLCHHEASKSSRCLLLVFTTSCLCVSQEEMSSSGGEGGPPRARGERAFSSRQRRGADTLGSTPSPSLAAWGRPGFLFKRMKVELDEAENISASVAQVNRGHRRRGPGGPTGEVIDITSLTDTSEEEASQPVLSKRAPPFPRPPGRGTSDGESRESLGAFEGPSRARKKVVRGDNGVVSACSSSATNAGGSVSEGPPPSEGGDGSQEGGPTRKGALVSRRAHVRGPPKPVLDASVILFSSPEGEEAIPEASLEDEDVCEATPTAAAAVQQQQQQQEQQLSTPLSGGNSCEGAPAPEEATGGRQRPGQVCHRQGNLRLLRCREGISEGRGPPRTQRGPREGSTGSLVRSGEKPRLFEYIREFWSEGGPPKAVVSLTFSNFSSATSSVGGAPPSAGRRQSGGDTSRGIKEDIKEEGEGLVSKVSCLTGDAFLPIDRAYAHGVYGDYITLTRELTKKKCSRKQQQRQQQQQQQQEQQGEEEDVEAVWETGSSTWYLEGHGGRGATRREVKAADVKALLEHFGLELANPAVYLSQELAKTFLFRASEHSLYGFYLCASASQRSRLKLKHVKRQVAEADLHTFATGGASALMLRCVGLATQLPAGGWRHVALKRMKEEAAFLRTAVLHLQAAEAAAAADDAAAEVSELERQLDLYQRKAAGGRAAAAADKQQQQVDRCREAVKHQQQEFQQLQQQQQQQKQQVVYASRHMRGRKGEVDSLRQDIEASKEMQATLTEQQQPQRQQQQQQQQQALLLSPLGLLADDASDLCSFRTSLLRVSAGDAGSTHSSSSSNSCLRLPPLGSIADGVAASDICSLCTPLLRALADAVLAAALARQLARSLLSPSCCVSPQTLKGPSRPPGAEAAELERREAAAASAAANLAAAEDTLQQLRRASAAAQQAAAKARGVRSETELRLQAAQHHERQAAYELQQQQQLLQRLQRQHAQRRQFLKDTLARERQQQQQQQQQQQAAAAAAAAAASAARDGLLVTKRQQQHELELNRLQQRRLEAPQRGGLYVNPRWQGPPPDLVGLLGSISDLLAQGRFTRAPLGPLGEYLFVDEAACQAAGVPTAAAQAILEEHLAMHAATWLVGSIEDQRLLQPVLQRHRWAPRIAVVNFACAPYSPRLTDEALGIPPQVLTLYKALRKEAQEGTKRDSSESSSTSGSSASLQHGAMPLAGIHFLVDSASIERVAIAENRRQLRMLLQGPPQQQPMGEAPVGGPPKGLREGYAWREPAHFKRQGRGTEGLPCAQGAARRPKGLVRASRPQSNTRDETPVVVAAAAAVDGPSEASAAVAEGAALEALEEELRQEQVSEETALQQMKEAAAAAKGRVEEASSARAQAQTAERAAAEELSRCEEAEAKQQAEVQIARDSRDDAQLALNELRGKNHRHLHQDQLLGLQEKLEAKERQRDEEKRQGDALQQRLDEALQALNKAQEASEHAAKELAGTQAQLAAAAKGVKAAEAALIEAEEKVERWKEEEAAAAAVASSRRQEIERKREVAETLRAEAQQQQQQDCCCCVSSAAALTTGHLLFVSVSVLLQRLQGKCVPLAPGEELPQLSAAEAERRLGSLEVRIRAQAGEARDEQEVEAELKESTRVLQAQEQQLLAPRAAAKLAEENSAKRTQKLVRAIELSSKQTKEDFRRVVESVLPHSATLVFDHQAQRISIQTKDRNQQQVVSDPRSLSGGEKSCVQVALLAALAKRSNSPAHIFDEVDVFMDERSRIKNRCLLWPQLREGQRWTARGLRHHTRQVFDEGASATTWAQGNVRAGSSAAAIVPKPQVQGSNPGR
ncbi:hypothetical protein ACSSS7_006950 [Eimeria intestinalis]